MSIPDRLIDLAIGGVFSAIAWIITVERRFTGLVGQVRALFSKSNDHERRIREIERSDR